MAKTYKTRGAKRRKTSRTRVTRITAPRFRKFILNQQEKKFYEYTVSNMACPTVGMAQSLLYGTSILWGGGSTVAPDPAAIVQGTTANTRIGQKIYLQSINICLGILPTVSGAQPNGCVMRYGIYHNKECNGVQVTYAQIFNGTGVTSLRNINYKAKVSVMKDLSQSAVTTGTDSTGATKAVGPTVLYKLSVHPKKIINYSAATATLADILKDDYGIFMACNQSSSMQMSLNVQLIYSDA